MRKHVSVHQALWVIDSQAIDIVLLDLNLTDAGRLDILREIKRRRPDIEVIVASANTRSIRDAGDETPTSTVKPFVCG